MIRFISNTQNEYKGYFHKDHLIQLLEQAEEITISVGFMKNSGWKIIKESLIGFLKTNGHNARFFIGTGEGVTDPQAVKELYRLIKRTTHHQLILCTPSAGIFHSKVYMFRKGAAVSIVTGSANLTHGGWLLNDELSILIETNVYSEEYRQLMHYFDGLQAQYHRPDLEDYIRRYEQAVNELRDRDRDRFSFAFGPELLIEGQVNLAMLRRYYELYPSSRDYVIPKDREIRYKRAKENLNILASNAPLSHRQFATLFGPLMGHQGYEKLWHSGSIHRATHMTYDYQDGFRDLVRHAQDCAKLPVEQAFDRVMHFLDKLKAQKKIKGIGENIVTEMLMSFNPNKFANLNENPLKVLKMAGCIFPTPGRFTGKNYKHFIFTLTAVRQEFEMVTFLEIDSFFNFIYWD